MHLNRYFGTNHFPKEIMQYAFSGFLNPETGDLVGENEGL